MSSDKEQKRLERELSAMQRSPKHRAARRCSPGEGAHWHWNVVLERDPSGGKVATFDAWLTSDFRGQEELAVRMTQAHKSFYRRAFVRSMSYKAAKAKAHVMADAMLAMANSPRAATRVKKTRARYEIRGYLPNTRGTYKRVRTMTIWENDPHYVTTELWRLTHPGSGVTHNALVHRWRFEVRDHGAARGKLVPLVTYEELLRRAKGAGRSPLKKLLKTVLRVVRGRKK